MKHQLLTLTAASFATLLAQAQNRPNIVFIMCDDLGYGDIACYGQKHIATPHIDRMAKEGTRFTQAYAGSPVSAPSRACVMTGQHTGHTHVRGNREYWREHNTPQLYGNNADIAEGWAGQEPYDTSHRILPEIFKQNGYTTGIFGKWAGGYESSTSTPDKRGVDEFLGFVCQFQAHAYYPNFLNAFSRSKGDTATHRVVLKDNIRYGMPGTADYSKRTQYSADIIHRAALDWIDKQSAEKPFLGIFTYTLPHAELLQPEDSLVLAYRNRLNPEISYRGDLGSRYAPTNEGHTQFAAMVSRLDKMVGEVIEKLRERGLEDNTLVIFTSDNGPHEEGGADPAFFNHDGMLRGTKRSTLEGGIRIPFIARWPGHVPEGRTSHQMFAFYDLLPTFCDVAGIHDFPQAYQQNSNDTFDGISFYPALRGNERAQAQHDHLYWEFSETDMLAVRRGRWKLVVQQGKCQLYDLDLDAHEDHDLAAQRPDIVDELVRVIHSEHQPHPLFPVTIPQTAQH